MEDLFKDLEISEEVKTALSDRIQAEIDLVKEGAVNNPEHIKQIRQQEAAKFFKSNEKIIKKLFGINGDDLDANLSGLARQEALLKSGKSSLEKNKDITNQQLQEQVISLTEEKRVLSEETLPSQLQDQKQRFHSRFIDDKIFKDASDIECIVGQKSKVPLVNAYLLDNNLKKVWDEDNGDYQILTNDNLKFTVNGKPLDKKQIIEMALEDVIKKSNGTQPQAQQQGRQKGQPANTDAHSSEAQQMASSFGVSI